MLNNLLEKALIQNGYEISSTIQQKMARYLELLQQWNQVFNLTAITEPKQMVLLHIVDSLSVNPFLYGQRLLDVGTGAGLPGIPLALVNPEKQFVLLDSNSKKTRFLLQAVVELNIKNIEVVHSRCEDFHPAFCFDSILSRAFASLKVMLTSTQHLLCPEGQFLAMKGVYPQQELEDVSEEFKILEVHTLKMAGLDADRCLVRVGKK